MNKEFFAVFNGVKEESILESLHRVIFENHNVPAKKIAKHLGIQYKTLSKMCSLESLYPSVPKFPVVKLPKLAELVDIEPVLDAICGAVGYVPAKLNDIDLNYLNSPVNALKKTQKATKEMAVTTEKVLEALEDGKITDEEWEELQTQMISLKKAIESLEIYLHATFNFCT